jgi:hypothetical protein
MWLLGMRETFGVLYIAPPKYGSTLGGRTQKGENTVTDYKNYKITDFIDFFRERDGLGLALLPSFG